VQRLAGRDRAAPGIVERIGLGVDEMPLDVEEPVLAPVTPAVDTAVVDGSARFRW
jgi:hypothetical protein